MYDGAAKQIGALVHAGAYHQTAVASALNDQPVDTCVVVSVTITVHAEVTECMCCCVDD